MLEKIEVGKTYLDNLGGEPTKRTVTFAGKELVIYELENGDECCDGIEEFKKFHSEIPIEKPKYYQVFYKRKDGDNAYATSILFKSKEHFLSYDDPKESDFDFITLKEVEL